MKSKKLISDAEGEFLYGLLKDHNVSGNIVEIGTYYAEGSTKIFLEYIHDHGGHLYALDIFGEKGQIEKVDALLPKDKTTIVQGFSVDIAKKWSPPIEFLFIDGDHGYPRVLPDGEQTGVALDILAYYPFLKVGGVIAFHDYTGDFKNSGVNRYLPIEHGVDNYLLGPHCHFLGKTERVLAFRKNNDNMLYPVHRPKIAHDSYKSAWRNLDKLRREGGALAAVGHAHLVSRISSYAKICLPGIDIECFQYPKLPKSIDSRHVIIAASRSEEIAIEKDLVARGATFGVHFTKYMDFLGWFFIGRYGFM